VRDATGGLRGRPGDPRPSQEPRPGPVPGEQARTPTVLVIEDQAGLRRTLLMNLRARQYKVLAAGTGRVALALALAHPPDAIILDLGLPDIDGTEVIAGLRRWYRAPIIVLSGRSKPCDKIGALDAGADDYVTKPFEMAELLARLRAALRRHEGSGIRDNPRPAIVGRWQVDLASYRVTGAGPAAGPAPAPASAPRLTPIEWQILQFLLRRPGQLVSPAELLTAVWGPGFERRTDYLRFHVARLRRKLEDDPARPRHLLTEHGMGYRYQP
jgi:two-component system, OmpR family, KDP operon response regulator KdpE